MINLSISEIEKEDGRIALEFRFESSQSVTTHQTKGFATTGIGDFTEYTIKCFFCKVWVVKQMIHAFARVGIFIEKYSFSIILFERGTLCSPPTKSQFIT